MLDTKVLRCGNLLTWSKKLAHPETTLPDEIVEVKTLYPNRIAYLYPNLENRVEPFEDDKAEQAENTIPLAELQPILLTEEWLTKAGAEMNNDTVVVQLCRFRWDGQALQPETDTANGQPLRYMHQLQNYMEATTGKPLNVNFN